MKKSYFELVLSKLVACKYFWQKQCSVIDIISTVFARKSRLLSISSLQIIFSNILVTNYQQFTSLKKMWLRCFGEDFFL